MGWNTVNQVQSHPLFDGISDDSYFYFVHSYYVDSAERSTIIGETYYGLEFASTVALDNVVATQFHPEKSGPTGLKMYDNFLKTALRGSL